MLAHFAHPPKWEKSQVLCAQQSSALSCHCCLLLSAHFLLYLDPPQKSKLSIIRRECDSAVNIHYQPSRYASQHRHLVERSLSFLIPLNVVNIVAITREG